MDGPRSDGLISKEVAVKHTLARICNLHIYIYQSGGGVNLIISTFATLYFCIEAVKEIIHLSADNADADYRRDGDVT